MITIPEMPEDASPDELLCDRCEAANEQMELLLKLSELNLKISNIDRRRNNGKDCISG
jgi:hypothetical protein